MISGIAWVSELIVRQAGALLHKPMSAEEAGQ